MLIHQGTKKGAEMVQIKKARGHQSLGMWIRMIMLSLPAENAIMLMSTTGQRWEAKP